MLFNSFEFGFFLIIVFTIYWLLKDWRRVQNLFVVLASYVFYGAWDWRFLVLIAFTTFCSWLSGLMIGSPRYARHARLITGANITINLLILGVFKYYNFFVSSFVEFFGSSADDFVLKNIILPVGISFYTFQALSYSIDVYRKKIEPTRDIIAFFAFISFFPQLVAGPIERATSLLPQFFSKRHFDYDDALDGARRMLWGFFKKIVVADNCAVYVAMVWSDYANQHGSTLALAVVFFAFQIYGDFSGYSDIAIGCAKLFGIHLNDNFKVPYFSRDLAELWRRWHISLNSWFVDYVYIPLGGSRGGKLKKIRNTFAIFLLSGLWHGANWTYICWGLYHAVMFIPLMLFGKNHSNQGAILPGKRLPTLKVLWQMLSTFILFCIGLIIFRAPTLGDAWRYLCGICSPSLFERGNIMDPTSYRISLYAMLTCVIVEWIQRNRRHGLDLSAVRRPWMRFAICYCILIYIVCCTGPNITFIYFQF